MAPATSFNFAIVVLVHIFLFGKRDEEEREENVHRWTFLKTR